MAGSPHSSTSGNASAQVTRHAPRMTLIGGGLGGALLAAYLGRDGFDVDLYERRPNPAAGNTVGGRSINLALSVRGIHALEGIGAADEILKLAIPMRGRMIHPLSGGTIFQPYDKDPSRHINSVGRAALNSALLRVAQQSNVRVHFDWRCTDVDLAAPAAELIHETTGETRRTSSDLLIGIDGAYSAVRRAMARNERFNFSQHFLGHGYKELSIPPAASGGFALDPHALHIWPRRSFMMIALPNPDQSFTCTLFYRFDGPESFAQLATPDDALRFFERTFPDALPLMPTLAEDFARNPVGSMVTMRCRPWIANHKVALVGDAAHAVVPFYGQGANAAFEDCVVLAEKLRSCGGDWPRALADYEAARRDNVNALADLAIHNFIEMRDHTGSRLFRIKKKIERTLQTLFPSRYTPLYTMVSFTRTPYAQARGKSEAQNRIVASAALLLLAGLTAALVHGLGGSRAPWLQSILVGAAVAAGVFVLAARKLRTIREAAVADGARR